MNRKGCTRRRPTPRRVWLVFDDAGVLHTTETNERDARGWFAPAWHVVGPYTLETTAKRARAR